MQLMYDENSDNEGKENSQLIVPTKMNLFHLRIGHLEQRFAAPSDNGQMPSEVLRVFSAVTIQSECDLFQSNTPSDQESVKRAFIELQESSNHSNPRNPSLQPPPSPNINQPTNKKLRLTTTFPLLPPSPPLSPHHSPLPIPSPSFSPSPPPPPSLSQEVLQIAKHYLGTILPPPPHDLNNKDIQNLSQQLLHQESQLATTSKKLRQQLHLSHQNLLQTLQKLGYERLNRAMERNQSDSERLGLVLDDGKRLLQGTADSELQHLEKKIQDLKSQILSLKKHSSRPSKASITPSPLEELPFPSLSKDQLKQLLLSKSLHLSRLEASLEEKKKEIETERTNLSLRTLLLDTQCSSKWSTAQSDLEDSNRLLMLNLIRTTLTEEIWEAYDTSTRTPVAVRLPTLFFWRSLSSEDRRACLEEVSTLNEIYTGINHQKILSILRLTVVNNRPAQILHGWHGDDLESYVSQKGYVFSEKESRGIFIQVLSSLLYLAQMSFPFPNLLSTTSVLYFGGVARILPPLTRHWFLCQIDFLILHGRENAFLSPEIRCAKREEEETRDMKARRDVATENGENLMPKFETREETPKREREGDREERGKEGEETPRRGVIINDFGQKQEKREEEKSGEKGWLSVIRKSDTWSLGFVFYKLLFACNPYRECSRKSRPLWSYNEPIAFNPSVKVSDSAKEFLKKLLVNSESRLTLQELMYDTYITTSIRMPRTSIVRE